MAGNKGVGNIDVTLIRIEVMDDDGAMRIYGGRYIPAEELFSNGHHGRYNNWERTRRRRKGLPPLSLMERRHGHAHREL
jgi:hypothetical protein